MRICAKCKISQSLLCFSKNRWNVSGYDHYCKGCNKERSLLTKESRARNMHRRYLANRDRILSKAKALRESPTWKPVYRYSEKDRASHKLYVENNRWRINSISAKRRALVRQATPCWANQEKIQAVYKLASKLNLHVDHIYPLKSPLVCGLHTETNLQLLTPMENRKKWNRVPL